MKTLARIAGAIAALVVLSSLSSAALKTGAKFVPFSLKNIDGNDYSVTMENGKLTLTIAGIETGETKLTKSHPAGVLLDFWATWCVPCRKAMPHMQQLNATYGPAESQTEGGLRVFGIALDDAGGKVVKPFYQKLKITYPMLADPPSGAAPDGVVCRAKDMKKTYEVQEIPVVYLIDATGTITHVHVGFKDEHIADLDKAIAVLFGEGKR
jgi:thiol-disulfide isomerase/thioredoxin